jgi:hypothetical protein
LLPAERLKAVEDLPGIVELLEYMLVRNPCLRPSLADVADRCQLPLWPHALVPAKMKIAGEPCRDICCSTPLGDIVFVVENKQPT